MTLLWTERLIAFACLLQTLELFFVPTWQWSVQAPEVPTLLRPLVRFYRPWLGVRLLAALSALLVPGPLAFVLLVLSTWMIALRWRGTFNGGSDSMTMVVLLACTAARLVPSLTAVALWYIAVQAVLSYAVAGVSKLRAPEWRQGQALAFFMKRPARRGDLFIAWLVIFFECAFPLALLNPALGLVFMGIGVVFHLLIAYKFALNRFFFAWLATYPAVYWASLHFLAA